ncbi:MAG: hypothetical protein K6F88_05700 [Ruminococcus sp.]|nr:hypothetical protein [Ruminococcus sp.]
MKTFRKTLSVTLTVLMIIGAVAIAPLSSFAAETGKSLTGVASFSAHGAKTVVKFKNGKTETVNNAVKAESLDDNPIANEIKSYEIKYSNKSVAKVELLDFSSIVNGYYALSFTVPNTEKEVFLTGLRPENVDVVEKKLLSNYTSGKDFVMEELDFIDAEKEMTGKDTNLCWAGTCANMLRYTGWAEKAGFESEDEILEVYSNSFYDEGFHVDSGLKWFFGGLKDDEIKVKGSGRYLPEYLTDNIISEHAVNMDFASQAPNMVKDLKAGKGVGLSIQWVGEDGEFLTLGHAVTLFGVVTDNAFDEDDLNHYDSFIIADSDNSTGYDDSDNRVVHDRHFAPNTLTLIKQEPYIKEDARCRTLIGKNYGGVLFTYTTLEPYSDAMSEYIETDPGAALNNAESVDFVFNRMSVSNVGKGAKSDKVYSGDVYFSFIAQDRDNYVDNSGKQFSGNIKINLEIIGENGSLVYSDTISKNVNLDEAAIIGDFKVENLETGKYKAVITINPDHSVVEAYYINNSSTTEFEVVPKEYDLSGVEVSIDRDVVEFDDYSTVVGIEYKGLDSSPLCSDFDEVNIYYTNYENGEWNLWSAYDPSGGEPVGKNKALSVGKNPTKESKLPDTVKLVKIGTKVKIRLEFIKDSVAYSVVSGEYPLSSRGFEVLISESNTNKTSVIPQGSDKLNDGDKFAFKIINKSVGNHEAIKGTYSLIAVYDDVNDERSVRLTEPVPFTLATGEETDEIVITSWKKSVFLNESCDVDVEVNAEGFDTEYTILSDLRIHEDKSTIITTAQDENDASDGIISLREAVAYAEETGSEIVVGEEIGNMLYLGSPVDINGSVSFNGAIDGMEMDSKRINVTVEYDADGDNKTTRLFNIGKDADARFKNVKMTNGSADLGAAVYIDGGTLKLDSCGIGFCTAKNKGGAVYLSGGGMAAKNTDFSSNTAPYGTDVFIDGGAKVEMLNCNVVPSVETSGVLYNFNGSLDVINSTIVAGDTDSYYDYENGKKFNRAIISNKNTNIINSIVFTRNSTAVAGDVNVYSSVTNGLNAEVTADSFTIEREIEEICRINEECTPFFRYFDADHFAPYLSEDAKLGSITSLKDGRIILTDSNGKVSQTGVVTSFTDEELSLDSLGNKRTTIFGAYSDILIYGEELDDENTTFAGIDDMIYTGRAITQKFNLYFNGIQLEYGVDYTVSYNKNINAGTAEIVATGINDYRGSVSHTFIIKKAANTMTVKTALKKVELSKLQKAKQTVKNAIVVSNNKGSVTYKKLSGVKNLTISKKGIITVKKGTTKGNYKIKVKVSAKGTGNYKSIYKTVTAKIKVK